MIEVKKITEGQCQSCMNTGKSNAIHLINKHYYVQITLCDNCLKELKRKLNFGMLAIPV